MAIVQGLTKLIAQLKAKTAATIKDSNVSCIVGYTAAYAIYVHENLQAQHKSGKTAKFLETPARLLHDELAAIIFKALQAGRTVAQALLLAGLKLQAESQKICPVDTGALKASAFTRIQQNSG